MKTLFSKNRLVKTFSGYIIIILVPLAVLVYQMGSSLKNHKEQIETNVHSRLNQLGDEFYRDLEIAWLTRMDHETTRKYHEYEPLVILDLKNSIARDEVYDRSPLYEETINNLSRLYTSPGNSDSSGSIDTSSISLQPDEILEESVVGYFQLDPLAQKIVTPYDKIMKVDIKPTEEEWINRYHDFLNQNLKQALFKRLDINKEKVDITNILVVLKTRRRHELMEPVYRKRYNPQKGGFEEVYKDGWVDVSYYQIKFFPYEQEGTHYLIALRPVVLDHSSHDEIDENLKKELAEQVPKTVKRILIQGFVINLDYLIVTSQSYLERSQPEYGNVVVNYKTEFTADTRILFEPLKSIGLKNEIGDDSYLDDYNVQRKRFWMIIVILTASLGLSLLHLGKLISANIYLHRKKNDFISSITHELKAPLTSIIMYTEMLEEGWARGKESTYYRYIHCESERLSRLIKNILDYSGIERGIFKLKKGSLLLHSFIEDTLEPLEVWIEKNGLKLNLEVKSTPYIRFDKDSLSQVIYNLCDNAIKYGKQGDTALLTIIVDEEQEFARLVIYDNGPGVAKEDEAKVFDRFYRCESELTRESTGTGLGLALVKELVEGNGGSISLYHPESGGFGIKILIPKIVMDASLVSQH